MTRDEFLSLPSTVALRILYDCLDEATVQALEQKEKPKLPLPPKYDAPIYRSGGTQFASETDIEGLRFWHGKALEPPRDPKYIEANKKRASELERWIRYRECFPDAVWSGERFREQVVAAAPSAKPMIHAKRANGGGGRAPAPPPDDTINEESDIPF